MKVLFKFAYHDSRLPSYPVGRNIPNSGQVIPIEAEVATILPAGKNNRYVIDERAMDVVQVLMETNPVEGDIVATITLNNG